MNTAYEKLLEHFEERELRYAAQEDRQSVTADFRGEVGTFRVVARVDDADGLFQVFAYLPVRTPVGARPGRAVEQVDGMGDAMSRWRDGWGKRAERDRPTAGLPVDEGRIFRWIFGG